MFNTETGEISHYDSLTQAGEAHGPINKPLRKSFLIPGFDIDKPIQHWDHLVYIETVRYEALMEATYDLIRNSEHASTPNLLILNGLD